MISRRTASALSIAYTAEFSYVTTSYGGRTSSEHLYMDRLYDWLYERDYEPWFSNPVRKIHCIRSLKDYILKIHTGESLVVATPDWAWDKRRQLGQQILENLARDFLVYYDEKGSDEWFRQKHKPHFEEVSRRLEMDGYVFRDEILLHPETEILDVEVERGLLRTLHHDLNLNRDSELFAFLDLSEKHYLNGDWSDSIGNARKFIEGLLQEVATRHASADPSSKLPRPALEKPVLVRQYLEDGALLEKREREMIDKLYGLLSHTGGHPYMAEQDQARLLRQLSLTVTQFILLRLQGFLRKGASSP